MLKLGLERVVDTPHGMFGRLTLPDGTVLFTCEERDRGNRPRVSCIPAGTYTCRRKQSAKFHTEVFEVLGVPGRSGIEFHPGNTTEDTEGCILPGMSLGYLTVADPREGTAGLKLAVLLSRVAFGRIMRAMGQEFRLEITDPA